MTYVTLTQVTEMLLALNNTVMDRMQTMADATQADIDNLTTQVNQVASDLGTTRDKLQAEIDALAANGVDVSALQAAVAPLDQMVNDLGNIQPTPPSPPTT